MANVLTIDSGLKGVGQGLRVNEREKLIRYNVALSGNYTQYVRGQNVGEVLDLTKVVGIFREDQNWGNVGPSRGYVLSVGSSGYSMSILPGADPLHWLLAIFSGVNTQLNAGAYPAGNIPLVGDLDIYVEFCGRRFD